LQVFRTDGASRARTGDLLGAMQTSRLREVVVSRECAWAIRRDVVGEIARGRPAHGDAEQGRSRGRGRLRSPTECLKKRLQRPSWTLLSAQLGP
jgi:hypothetical protein